jgi:hypothetical protein
MAAPPRMLLLSGGGTEAFVLMPTTFDVSPSSSHILIITTWELYLTSGISKLIVQKALAAAQEKFQIPKDTHITRLSCKASDMPWIGGYAGTQDIFMYVSFSLFPRTYPHSVLKLDRSPFGVKRGCTDERTDNDSYHYACAGKHVVRLDVHAWDKNVSLHPGLWQSV